MQKDDATWLNIGYLLAALMIALVFWKAFMFVGSSTSWSDVYGSWYSPAATMIALLLGGGAVFLLRHDADRHAYFLSAIAELRKVTWPTWENTKKLTMIVCVVVGVFAVILSVFDLVWARVLKLLLV